MYGYLISIVRLREGKNIPWWIIIMIYIIHLLNFGFRTMSLVWGHLENSGGGGSLETFSGEGQLNNDPVDHNS